MMSRVPSKSWQEFVKEYRGNMRAASSAYRRNNARPLLREARKKGSLDSMTSSSEDVARVRGPPKLTKNDEQFLRKLPPYLSLESNDVLAMLLTQAIARECHGRAGCASMFDAEWTIKAKGRYGSIIKTLRLECTDGDKKERAEAGRGFREWLSSRFTVL